MEYQRSVQRRQWCSDAPLGKAPRNPETVVESSRGHISRLWLKISLMYIYRKSYVAQSL
jgi:hypothetical protein